MADFADRSLGIGYAGGSALLFVCVMLSPGLWYRSQGGVSVAAITTPKAEGFYWATITLSQTLGTALGDWAADSGLGFMVAERWYSLLTWRSSRQFITRLGFRMCYCSGRCLFSPDPWAPRSATSLISPKPRRVGHQPPAGLADHRYLHPCLYSGTAAAAGSHPGMSTGA